MSTGEQQFQTIRNDERGAVGRSIVVGVILTFLIETCLGLWRIESSIKPSPSALNEWERPTLTSNPLVYPAYQRPPRKLPTVEIGFVNDKMGDIIDSGPQGKGIAYPLASLFLQGHYDGRNRAYDVSGRFGRGRLHQHHRLLRADDHEGLAARQWI